MSEQAEPKYSDEDSAVIDAELKHIGGTSKRHKLYGLALSGGGIRSASFGLGVMQALVGEKVLKKIDYLSTVSGGGYIGTSLTWFLNRGRPKTTAAGHFQWGKAGTTGDDFPFGKPSIDRRSDENSNKILDYIRQHANYLTPGEGLDAISLLAVILRSTLVSLLVYLLIATGFLCLFRYGIWVLVPVSVGLCGTLAILACLLSLASRVPGPWSTKRYIGLILSQRWFGRVLSFAGALLLIGSLYYVYDWLSEWLEGYGGLTALLTIANLATAFGFGVGVYEFWKEQTSEVKNEGLLSSILLNVGSFALIYGLLLLAFILAVYFTDALDAYFSDALDDKNGIQSWGVAILLGAALSLAGCVFGLLANVNYLSPHRMYRDRLMETFLPNVRCRTGKGNPSVPLENNKWGPATDADDALLKDMCLEPNCRPYHLINTNVVLVDSRMPRYKGRGGDSFLLSPIYCGSSATGWIPTENYTTGKRGITLPTAMAISGAAANPNTGVGGKGATRGRLLSTLMGLLNLRLGYWAPNPGREFEKTLANDPLDEAVDKREDKEDLSNWELMKAFFWKLMKAFFKTMKAFFKTMKAFFKSLLQFFRKPPNFIYPNLRGGILVGGLHEGRDLIQLTDGGHFENLALYELFRRRVKIIIASDAGADPDFAFTDLANAVERARVDFGVTVVFHSDSDEFPLTGVQPGLAEEGSLEFKYNLADRGFAVADIYYPARTRGGKKTEGKLLYIKTTMIPDLPEDIKGYKRTHSSFPDQPTADQFFDESQFEAYRELGYQITKRMLEEITIRQTLNL